MESNIWSLSWRDLVKGLIIAVITPVLTIALDTLNAGSWVFNFQKMGSTAAIAAASYLIHQFITNTNASAADRLQDAATKTGEPIVITPKQ